MPITGLSFLLFALAAVVLYYLFPKRLRQYVLLAASILFYLTYGVRMAGYLAATILLTYLFGLWLDRLAAFRPAAETKEERKRQKRANDRKKRRVLALSLVLNFASLADVYKRQGDHPCDRGQLRLSDRTFSCRNGRDKAALLY